MPFDFGQICFALLCLASLSLWFKFFRSSRPVLQPRLRIQSPLGLLDVAILFLCWFLSQASAVGVLVFVMGVPFSKIDDLAHPDELTFMGVASLLQLLWTIAGLGIIAIRYGYAPRIFGWQPENFRKDLRIGAVAFVMIVPVVLAIQLFVTQFFEYEHATLESLEKNPGIFTIVVTWFSAVLVAPITEEIFFRGTFQAWLQRQNIMSDPNQIETILGGWTRFSDGDDKVLEPEPRRRTMMSSTGYQPFRVVSDLKNSDRMLWLPIFVSAFVFAGIHLGQGPAPIPLFVFGLALGYLYRQTGSITVCIVLHLLLNAFSMLMFTLQTLAG